MESGVVNRLIIEECIIYMIQTVNPRFSSLEMPERKFSCMQWLIHWPNSFDKAFPTWSNILTKLQIWSFRATISLDSYFIYQGDVDAWELLLNSITTLGQCSSRLLRSINIFYDYTIYFNHLNTRKQTYLLYSNSEYWKYWVRIFRYGEELKKMFLFKRNGLVHCIINFCSINLKENAIEYKITKNDFSISTVTSRLVLFVY